MLAKNEKQEQVAVPEAIVKMLDEKGITDFKKRSKVVKITCGLDLVPESVEEQIAGSGTWTKHTRKGSEEENMYVDIPGAVLRDGNTCQGIFIRAEIAPALYQELGRLLEDLPDGK